MSYRILCLGEILFDVYPNFKRLGGAPFNFSYHQHCFGETTAFISSIGDDENGQEILIHLKERGFPTDFIQVDPAHPTGAVIVNLDEEGVPDFKIADHVAYDFIKPEKKIEAFISAGVDLVYFGTLAQRHMTSRNTIHRILDSLSGDRHILYDVNLRQSFYSQEILEKSLEFCTVVKLNVDEFDVVKKMFKLEYPEEEAALKMMERFKLSNICITKGARGSSLYFDENKIDWKNSEEELNKVKDTVGAGDGYAAVLAHGILEKWPAQKIIRKASQFAAALCTISGAIPDDLNFYIRHAPKVREANE